MKKLVRAFEYICEWSGRIVAPIVGFITIILIYEMVVRYAFNKPTVWVHETSQFLFAAYAFVAGAFTYRRNLHVNMDIIYRNFSLRGKAVTDILTSVISLAYILALLWYGGLEAWDSIRVREISTTVWGPPIYPVRVMIPLAAFLILLQWLAQFIRNLMIVFTEKEFE